MTSISRTLRRCLPLAFAAALALPARAQETAPAEESATRFEAVLGGQTENDLGRGEARFEEFRDVPKGAVFEFGRFAYGPQGEKLDLSFTAIDAAQDDQRYFLNLWVPGVVSFRANYVERPRFYSNGAKALWSGIGTGRLTIDETFRQGAEAAAGDPKAPFASPALKSYMDLAFAAANPFDLKTKRKDLGGALDFTLAPSFTLALTGRHEKKDGEKPIGFGTYIRRQALAGTPGTGAGNFWRESIEARGGELVEPVRYKTTEIGATFTWAKNGHSASAGWFGSRFRNDVTSLYFDNPFEASPGRASATTFDPRADQEPASPNGNNNLRGLYARSAIQLWPNNDYDRFFGTVSLKITDRTRLNGTVARGTFKQDDAFMPYAENDQVVFSGTAGQPGVVYAKDAPLPRPSLNGKMTTTQADVKLTSRLVDALDVRAGYRYYALDDERPEILFPGFSSSGDSYFRAGIGQKDAAGNRILFNEVGGYARQRLNLGAAYRIGVITLDGEYARTSWNYDVRQVDRTVENAYRGSAHALVGGANVSAFYQRANRDYRGTYVVGLETSGVRAYDVFTRRQDLAGADADVPVGENLVVGIGGRYEKSRYPGAAEGFTYGYGLQDSRSKSVFANASYTKDGVVVSAWSGFDDYEWNSLQVTKTSLGADYNPIDRWTRSSRDRVVFVGFEAVVPITKQIRTRADVNYQHFTGDWNTENVATPDVNSAVAYAFPGLSDSVLTLRGSLVWDVTRQVGFEVRYWYEPYRLDDFTIDGMQPYMQGSLKETRSAANDIGDMNVSRFTFLDSRYTSYTAHVVSAFVHLRF